MIEPPAFILGLFDLGEIVEAFDEGAVPHTEISPESRSILLHGYSLTDKLMENWNVTNLGD